MIVRFEQNGEAPVLQADTRDMARPFSSGKTGFWAGGKIVIDGERYQVSCSVVKIGSGPAKQIERDEHASA